VTRQGDLVTLALNDSVAFVTQGLASKAVNINPFNVMSWFGSTRLIPTSDTWFDVITKPTVTINLFDENDGWIGERPFKTTWSNWTTNWTGVSTKETVTITHRHVDGDPDAREQWIRNITLTTTRRGNATREGVEITQKASIIAKDLGEKTIDISISPYMRSVNIGVIASGLQPGAEMIALFDDVDVTAFVERANEIHLTSNTDAETFRVGDLIISNATTNPGRARVLGITDNILRVVEATGVFYRGSDTATTVSATYTVADTGGGSRTPTGTVARYICYAGKVPRTGIAVTPSAKITLDPGGVGSSTSDLFVGQTIYFSGGGTMPLSFVNASAQ